MTNNSNMYRLNQDGSRSDKISNSGVVRIYNGKRLRCYVDTKNTPYTEYDNYQQGIKKDDSLNTTSKVPITLYCYDDETIRNTKRKVPSIYRNTTLQEVVNHMANQCDIKLEITPFDNNERFDQILIPNLSFTDAIAYLDSYYGLYESGAMLSTHIGSGVLVLTKMSRDYCITTPNVIRVTSYKSGDTYSGPWIVDALSSGVVTPDTSVDVKSATDIEQTVNARIFSSINVDDFNVETSTLNETFEDSRYPNITTPDMIHKTKNKFLTSMYKTLVEEKNTLIDVSLNGDYLSGLYSASDRISFSFDNNQRAIDIDRLYRIKQSTDVFTNIGSGLFSGQTTIRLC